MKKLSKFLGYTLVTVIVLAFAIPVGYNALEVTNIALEGVNENTSY